MTLRWSYQDEDKNKSIVLEVVCDESLSIWHVFFGILGVNNNTNVLDESPLVGDISSGEAS